MDLQLLSLFKKMSLKSCIVLVHLHIRAVSCPGVWLCPNGEVVLKLCMFGDIVSTCAVNPELPLHYGEKFTFQKVYKHVRHLTDLQQQLEKEYFNCELIQSNDDRSVVLATYQTTVSELLFPSPLTKTLIAGVNVDLLMVTTKHFPGFLAPKIELSTKTTIEEAVASDTCCTKFAVINPKMLCSKVQNSKDTSRSTTCNGRNSSISKGACKCMCRTKTDGTEGKGKSDIEAMLRDHLAHKESDNRNLSLQHGASSCEVCSIYHRYFGEMKTPEVQGCHHQHHYKHYHCPRYSQQTRWLAESLYDDKNYREEFYKNLYKFYQTMYSHSKNKNLK